MSDGYTPLIPPTPVLPEQPKPRPKAVLVAAVLLGCGILFAPCAQFVIEGFFATSGVAAILILFFWTAIYLFLAYHLRLLLRWAYWITSVWLVLMLAITSLYFQLTHGWVFGSYYLAGYSDWWIPIGFGLYPLLCFATLGVLNIKAVKVAFGVVKEDGR
jgi:hypothetical protein